MKIKGKPYLSVNIVCDNKKEHKESVENLNYSTLSQNHFLEAFDELIKEKKINISKAKIFLYE